MSKLCALLIFLALWPSSAAFCGYAEAEAAFTRGAYAVAGEECGRVIRSLKTTRKERGKAHYLRGVMVRNGLGMERNAHEAWLSYNAAIRLGCARGKYGLALMLRSRRSLLPASAPEVFFPDAFYADALFAQALPALEKEAKAGDRLAQGMTGRMYEKGYGTEPDAQKAREWYRRAAENGNAAAQINLGLMLLQGRGGARDPDAAGRWFQIAARNGDPRAQLLWGVANLKGWSAPVSLDAALRWISLAAGNGLPEAQTALGYILSGNGPARDLDSAITVLTKAAAAGQTQACLKLAFLLEGRDRKRALRLYQEAARFGDANACAALGAFLAKSGAPADYPDALRFLRAAAERGHPEARHNMAVMYQNGWGVPPSPIAAWLWRDAQGDVPAQATPDSPLQWLIAIQ